jgi:hypothetical protein
LFTVGHLLQAKSPRKLNKITAGLLVVVLLTRILLGQIVTRPSAMLFRDDYKTTAPYLGFT